jgi:hypothetical protein
MSEAPRNQGFALILAWTVVGVPLAWGVVQVFNKALDLFR